MVDAGQDPLKCGLILSNQWGPPHFDRHNSACRAAHVGQYVAAVYNNPSRGK